jgi:hypothetical protein
MPYMAIIVVLNLSSPLSVVTGIHKGVVDAIIWVVVFALSKSIVVTESGVNALHFR